MPATGNENKQNNSCESVRTRGQIGCINIAEGDRNIQSNACNSVGDSVGLLQLATTIPRQVFANQLMLPASILQMATTILKTTIVTQ